MANNSSRRTDKVVFIGDELAYALEVYAKAGL